MFILDRLMPIFKEFLSVSGGGDLKYPPQMHQPDIKFEWRGDSFWGYVCCGGFRIHGITPTKTIDAEWSEFFNKLRAIEREKRKEQETDDNQN